MVLPCPVKRVGAATDTFTIVHQRKRPCVDKRQLPALPNDARVRSVLTAVMAKSGTMPPTFGLGLMERTTMARFLIMLGLAILVIGVLWPYLARIGLGRLPGDIVVERDNVTFYFPIVTCLLLSVVFSAVLWAINR
jgi:hypothetical protein